MSLHLIPTEAWQYSSLDIVRALLPALNRRNLPRTVPLPGLGEGLPIRSARAAAVIALKALGLPAGAKVGVPLYCCPVVFKAIALAGCTPRFLDIDPETFCVSLRDLYAKRDDIDAIVAVHMFGNICDMPAILEAMRGKPVIEDCAQSLGSTVNGHASGSFGDISLFSFRSGKYLSVGEGGALYAKDARLSMRIAELISGLPAPTVTEELKHIVVTYLRSKLRSQPLWGPVGSKVWGVYNRTTDFSDKSPIMMGQIYASDQRTTTTRIRRLDSMVASQRVHAARYERDLQFEPGIVNAEPPGTFLNRFMYPLTFSSVQQRDRLREYFHRQSISTAKPYEDVIKGAADAYGYDGDCPVAEMVLRRTLVIPCHYLLKDKDVEHIAVSLQKGITDIGATAFCPDAQPGMPAEARTV